MYHVQYIHIEQHIHIEQCIHILYYNLLFAMHACINNRLFCIPKGIRTFYGHTMRKLLLWTGKQPLLVELILPLVDGTHIIIAVWTTILISRYVLLIMVVSYVIGTMMVIDTHLKGGFRSIEQWGCNNTHMKFFRPCPLNQDLTNFNYLKLHSTNTHYALQQVQNFKPYQRVVSPLNCLEHTTTNPKSLLLVIVLAFSNSV